MVGTVGRGRSLAVLRPVGRGWDGVSGRRTEATRGGRATARPTWPADGASNAWSTRDADGTGCSYPAAP